MEVALIVFRVGVGVGALLVGIGLLVAVVSLRPLVRDARALAKDTQRLARLAEQDLPELLQRAHSVAADAELLTEDLAVRLEQLNALAETPPGRGGIGPVQSGDAAEDEQIA